ncbi:MAG TPA: hypothetical protein VMV87_16820, partial [Burkholderiales bacterium]|nr:hypothetical protein [Burkholderiales bacterium]
QGQRAAELHVHLDGTGGIQPVCVVDLAMAYEYGSATANIPERVHGLGRDRDECDGGNTAFGRGKQCQYDD